MVNRDKSMDHFYLYKLYRSEGLVIIRGGGSDGRCAVVSVVVGTVM